MGAEAAAAAAVSAVGNTTRLFSGSPCRNVMVAWPPTAGTPPTTSSPLQAGTTAAGAAVVVLSPTSGDKGARFAGPNEAKSPSRPKAMTVAEVNGPVSVTTAAETDPKWGVLNSRMDEIHRAFREGRMDGKNYHCQLAQLMLEIHAAHPKQAQAGLVPLARSFEALMDGKEPLLHLADGESSSKESTGATTAFPLSHTALSTSYTPAVSPGHLLWALRQHRLGCAIYAQTEDAENNQAAKGDTEFEAFVADVLPPLFTLLLPDIYAALAERSKLVASTFKNPPSAAKQQQQATKAKFAALLGSMARTAAKIARQCGLPMPAQTREALAALPHVLSQNADSELEVAAVIVTALRDVTQKFSQREQALFGRALVGKLSKKLTGRASDMVAVLEVVLCYVYPDAKDELQYLTRLSERATPAASNSSRFPTPPIEFYMLDMAQKTERVMTGGEALQSLLEGQSLSEGAISHLNSSNVEPTSLPTSPTNPAEVSRSDERSANDGINVLKRVFVRLTIPKPAPAGRLSCVSCSLQDKDCVKNVGKTTLSTRSQYALTHCSRTRLVNPQDPQQALNVETLISEQSEQSTHGAAVTTYKIEDDGFVESFSLSTTPDPKVAICPAAPLAAPLTADAVRVTASSQVGILSDNIGAQPAAAYTTATPTTATATTTVGASPAVAASTVVADFVETNFGGTNFGNAPVDSATAAANESETHASTSPVASEMATPPVMSATVPMCAANAATAQRSFTSNISSSEEEVLAAVLRSGAPDTNHLIRSSKSVSSQQLARALEDSGGHPTGGGFSGPARSRMNFVTNPLHMKTGGSAFHATRANNSAGVAGGALASRRSRVMNAPSPAVRMPLPARSVGSRSIGGVERRNTTDFTSLQYKTAPPLSPSVAEVTTQRTTLDKRRSIVASAPPPLRSRTQGPQLSATTSTTASALVSPSKLIAPRRFQSRDASIDMMLHYPRSHKTAAGARITLQGTVAAKKPLMT